MPLLPPLTLGPNLLLDPPLVLAPMAGYTDLPFRRLCRRYGATLVYTEVIMADAIARRIPQALHYLTTTAAEQPVVAHFYGKDPAAFATAAQVALEHAPFAAIDINCGCPIRKIRNKGCGVALLQHPDLVGEIVQAVRAVVPVPVTVKTRIGLTPDHLEGLALARAAEAAGAAAVTIHARPASVGHSGPPNWAALRAIREALTIPVLGNGGLRTLEDVAVMLRETGCAGAMIGRGAVGKPWIFAELRAALAGQTYPAPEGPALVALVREHLEALTAHMTAGDRTRRLRRHGTEFAACGKFRSHLVRYVAGFPGRREFLRGLENLRDQETLLAAFARLADPPEQPR
ncbi:MAG: tRNA-dihydrouridine synthase family protein [Candidatus Marinimicrobia bacterium]|nr:tRNA-dihydrouridine synthase family protein [Candidatus Neomarinimicrobiota bacterium]